MGGHQSMLYASQFPHRIEALFLVSPCGNTAYDPETYDPYSDPSFEDPSKVNSREKCDEMIRKMKNKEHMLQEARKFTGWMIDV